MSGVDENPYIVIVAKKVRNLKKKLRNIEEYAEQEASGKALVQEQKDMIATKDHLCRSITDLEAIQTTMLDFEKQEKLRIKDERTKANALKKSGGAAAVKATSEAKVLSEQDVMELQAKIAALNLDEYESGKGKGKKGGKGAKDKGYEEDIKETTVKIEDSPTDVERRLRKLVKILHVVEKYSRSTDKELPASVEYFAASVMGSTSPEKSDGLEIIGGVTYPAMAETVDALALELGDVPIEPVATEVDVDGSTVKEGKQEEAIEGGDKKKRKKKKKVSTSETEVGEGEKEKEVAEAPASKEKDEIVEKKATTGTEKEKKKKPRPKKTSAATGSASVGDKPAGPPARKEGISTNASKGGSKGTTPTTTSNKSKDAMAKKKAMKGDKEEKPAAK